MFSDDLTGLVFHAGHLSSSIGYIGDEYPLYSARSAIGIGKESANKHLFFDEIFMDPNPKTEIEPLLINGVATNLELYGDFVEKMVTRIGCKIQEQPLILTSQDNESAYGTERLKLSSIFFEKKNATCLFFVSKALCSLFATGRLNGLLLDSGAHSTELSALYDGYILKRSVKRIPFGGEEITRQLRVELEEKLGQSNLPPFNTLFANASQGGPQGVAQLDRAVRMIKENALSAAAKDEREGEDKILFELPDGAQLELKSLADPSRVLFAKKANQGFELQSQLFSILNDTHVDCRKVLSLNIVVTGGNSLLPRFQKNLEAALAESLAFHLKPKIHVPAKPVERKLAPWLGASILSSVEAFQNLWISRNEFLEIGESCIARKCLN